MVTEEVLDAFVRHVQTQERCYQSQMVAERLNVGALADGEHNQGEEENRRPKPCGGGPAPGFHSSKANAPGQTEHGQTQGEDRRPPAIDHDRVDDQWVTAAAA